MNRGTLPQRQPAGASGRPALVGGLDSCRDRPSLYRERLKSVASHLVKPLVETARLTHQSLERGLRILETVALNGGTTTLAETVRRTALHRSTAHHLLQTLVSFGYLHQDRQTRGYELTAKLFRLTRTGVDAGADRPDRRAGDPGTDGADWRRLERRHFHEWHHHPSWPSAIPEIRSASSRRSGKPRPIHATAVGKAIVAFLPSAERTAIAARLTYERYTPRTIASREDFEAEMLRIQAAGYAVDDEEHHEGVRCMAAPVFSYAGHVVACLCVLGPKFRMTRRKLRELRVPLLERAKSLSTRLGWNDDIPPTTTTHQLTPRPPPLLREAGMASQTEYTQKVVKIPEADLRQRVYDMLTTAGASEESAEACTRALVYASRVGLDSHGVRLTPHYCAMLQSGPHQEGPEAVGGNHRAGDRDAQAPTTASVITPPTRPWTRRANSPVRPGSAPARSPTRPITAPRVPMRSSAPKKDSFRFRPPTPTSSSPCTARRARFTAPTRCASLRRCRDRSRG